MIFRFGLIKPDEDRIQLIIEEVAESHIKNLQQSDMSYQEALEFVYFESYSKYSTYTYQQKMVGTPYWISGDAGEITKEFRHNAFATDLEHSLGLTMMDDYEDVVIYRNEIREDGSFGITGKDIDFLATMVKNYRELKFSPSTISYEALCIDPDYEGIRTLKWKSTSNTNKVLDIIYSNGFLGYSKELEEISLNNISYFHLKDNNYKAIIIKTNQKSNDKLNRIFEYLKLYDQKDRGTLLIVKENGGKISRKFYSKLWEVMDNGEFQSLLENLRNHQQT